MRICGLRSLCVIMIINTITQWNVSNETTLLHIEIFILQIKTFIIATEFYNPIEKYSIAQHFRKFKKPFRTK